MWIFGQTPWTAVDQTFTIHTPLLTGSTAGVGTALQCWPPKKLSPRCCCHCRRLEQGGCRVGKVQIKQCVCWKAWRRPVAKWPYIQVFQITIRDIIIAVLHCAFGLYRQAVHTWDLLSCTISSDLRATRYRKVDKSAIDIA